MIILILKLVFYFPAKIGFMKRRFLTAYLLTKDLEFTTENTSTLQHAEVSLILVNLRGF